MPDHYPTNEPPNIGVGLSQFYASETTRWEMLFILLFIFQLGSEDAFSKLTRDIGRISSEHSASISASKTESGQSEITDKNNDRIQDLVSKSLAPRLSFEYRIQTIDQDPNGEYQVVLQPDDENSKSDLVRRRSLTIPVSKDLGESLFPGDYLAFTGKLKTGAEPRSKAAVPFAVVRPDGLKLLAIWIDEIAIGESKQSKTKVSDPDSDVVTPNLFLSEIDRLFKEARKAISSGKSSADRQDSADEYSKIIFDTIKNFDGREFEFETEVKDVIRGKNGVDFEVVVSYPMEIRSSIRDNAPLQMVRDITFSIAEEDRSEFVIGRNLNIRAQISIRTSNRFDSIDLSELNFGKLKIDSRYLADGRAVVEDQFLYINLNKITTEFIPEKSRSKRSNKEQKGPPPSPRE